MAMLHMCVHVRVCTVCEHMHVHALCTCVHTRLHLCAHMQCECVCVCMCVFKEEQNTLEGWPLPGQSGFP